MIVSDPNLAEIAFVCENMRDKSQEDVFGVVEASPSRLAQSLHRAYGFKWVFYHDGLPCAALGATQVHTGVWSLFGFGTDDWQKVWRLVTLVAKRDMMQAVSDTGAHRAHCVSPASHTDTHKWLWFLGANHVVEMPKYGRKGEDYLLFAWLRE